MPRLESEPRSIGAPQAGGRRRSKPKAATPAMPAAAALPVQPVGQPASDVWLICSGLVLLAGAWAYLPTLIEIVKAWIREPDYSHGFLVIPVAIFFLWVRRAQFPGIGAPDYRIGLSLVGAGLLIRYLAALFFMEFLDGYSILFWLAGGVALLGGRRLLWWALPSVAFLFFMIPLPFGIETALSAPLQRIATKLTSLTLQTLGYSAFAEGNVIMLGENRLEVAEACSGLRLFMTIVAVAYAYIAIGRPPPKVEGSAVRLLLAVPFAALGLIWFIVALRWLRTSGDSVETPEPPVLVRRAWWENLVLLMSVVPIAIVANAARVVVTGLLFEYTTGEVAHQFAHDFAGYAMIGLAAALFGIVLWYLSVLIREDEIIDMSVLVREVEQ